ncbi:MAG TPA: DUF5666 domain-containing protein [Mycobacterium sp.]
MHATSPTARLSRLAILAVTGATALSVAACGASNNAKPTSANPTGSYPTSSSPSASAKGKDWVSGLIDSVSGNTIQVSQRSGTATVDFTPSTVVSEVTAAHLTDVTAGSCVSVHPGRRSVSTSGGGITARSVRVSTAVDGKCPQPNQPAGADDTPAPGAPARHREIGGQVTSVAGNTITVNSTDPGGNSSQTSVTVTDTTKYTKQTTADAQALAQGKCVAAHGTTDNGGTLQATTITVQQADNGTCPQLGGRRHRH